MIFKYLLDFLFLEDICNLEKCNKKMYELIKEREIWKKIYEQRFPNNHLGSITEKKKWKELYLEELKTLCKNKKK